MSYASKLKAYAKICRLEELWESRELPLLEEVMDDLVATMQNSEPDGLWNIDFPEGFSSNTLPYNRMPSGGRADCRQVLLVYGSGGEQFEDRMHEMLEHVKEKCPDTTQIYFVTDTWMPDIWKAFEQEFCIMRPQLTVILYALGRPVVLLV